MTAEQVFSLCSTIAMTGWAGLVFAPRWTVTRDWARDGGNLRVAHFFGMHAMHAFPLFALLLPMNWGEKRKLGVLSGFIICYAGLSAGTFIQAINGQPFTAGWVGYLDRLT